MNFVTRTAAAGAGLVIVPRHVLGRGFQAPSDTVNIATVGVSGMGSSNTSAVLSQNIVAFCDVDFGLLDSAHRALEEAGGRRRRPTPQRPRRAPAPRPRREPTAGAARREREASARRTAPRPQAVRRRQQLPKIQQYRDYREMLDEAEGHRRGHRRHARSHARRDRAGGDGRSASTSTCRSRSAGRSTRRGSWRRRRRTIRRSSRRWATRATRATRRGSATNTSRRARSATCAKCTSGRTVRSATGRRACRVRRRCPRRLQDPATAGRGGVDRDVDARLAAALVGNYPPSDQLVWDLFLGVAPPGRVSPDLSPVQLARLGGLGPGRARRHGRAPHRSSVLVAEARDADGHRDAVRRRSTARPIRTRRRPTTSSRRAAACRR